MDKKIVYIVKTKLHYYPPCVSQIRMIHDLGYEVEVLYGTSNESAIKLLEDENIRCEKIGNISDDCRNKILKLYNFIKFRFSLGKKIKKYDQNNTLFWFGTAETSIPMIGKLNNIKYVVSFLELLDDNKLKVKLLKGIANKAAATTVCEETRGYIMKYWWKLNKLPFVFPNKPYNLLTEKNNKGSIDETKKIISKIKGKKVILYQGIIQNTEELCEIAKALKEINKNYIFVLMGIDKYNSVKKIEEIYNNMIYVNYIPAPYHLEITSNAYIGITFYRNDSLNKAFCAPNKIYEYSGFGIPILANDIPGLKNTIGKFNAAECIQLNKNNVIEALNKIEENYEKYSANAKNFFASTDNKKTMRKLFLEINIK
ncbi:MAG: hypothetical protein U0O04_04090 [Clostridia bacterium]